MTNTGGQVGGHMGACDIVVRCAMSKVIRQRHACWKSRIVMLSLLPVTVREWNANTIKKCKAVRYMKC